MHTLQKKFVRSIPNDTKYHTRIQRELELIEKFKFADMFQKMTEILKLAEGTQHIVRGSASCSLVCYLLGISNIDPIEHNVSLARFMNDYRPDMPDIDIDLPHHQRDNIITKIFDKWEGKVARISNKIHYRKNGAIREAMRQLGYKWQIPRKFDLSELMPTKIQQVIELAASLEGKQSHYSLHCGGILFYEQGIPQELKIGYNQISLDKNDVERENLLKIDLLCNRGLSQLLEIDTRDLHTYPKEDKKVSDLLANGDVIGLTFAESPTFRKAVKATKPQNIEELAMTLALIRPAAASRGRKRLFIDQWLEDKTMNQVVFEDDAIFKIQQLLNCSEDEADYYRRAFAKANYKTILEFKKRLSHKKDIDVIIGELSCIRMYSFCKSHALSYAYLVWGLAYNKVYNTKNFWKAALNNCKSMYRPWVYIQEAKKAGLSIDIGKPKWSLTGDRLTKNENQLLLFENSPIDEYHKYGYWFKDILPNNLYTKEDAGWLTFRGLIACYRKMKDLTYVTIGDCTGNYYDLIIDAVLDLHDADIIRGQGEIYNEYGNKTIKVYRHKVEKL